MPSEQAREERKRDTLKRLKGLLNTGRRKTDVPDWTPIVENPHNLTEEQRRIVNSEEWNK